MSSQPEQAETQQEEVPEAEAVEAEPERERMPPLESRFLYVDVAARRAKQLRRGALPRLQGLRPDPDTGERPSPDSKLERIAMAEVDEGLIVYELPDSTPPAQDAEQDASS